MPSSKMIGSLSMAGVLVITAYGMGCSSSTKSPGGTIAGDSGTPATMDSSVKSGSDGSTGTTESGTTGPGDSSATQDSTGSQDSGGDGSVGECPSSMPYQAITWAPPTPFTPGACTAAQITQYTSDLQAGMLPTSGSATCDNCLQTPETASAHGPIITILVQNVNEPASLNRGGCLYNVGQMAADDTATGCGANLNNYEDCLGQECVGCSDFETPMTGGPTEMCVNSACMAEILSSSCQSEVEADGGVALCTTGSFADILTAWCGGTGTGTTDSGTSDAGGVTDGGGTD